jgi:hypothetical protein
MGLRDHHQSGGIFIQSVNDASSWEPRQDWVMMQKSIQKSSAPVSTARMNHQTGGLVYDDNRIILVENVERDIFG